MTRLLTRGGAATRDTLRDVAGRRTGLVALLLVGTLLFVVALAPVIAPYDPAEPHIEARLQGPSAEHWLGTDHLGRDLLSRAIFGARLALSVALPAGALALLVGLLIGLLAGYVGGRTDRALVVLMDSMQAFPAVILALGLLALLGPSLRNTTLVIAVAFAPAYARMARASVFVVREEPYIEAERSLGAGNRRILVTHVLPNIIAPLFILMAINVPVAVTIEAGLSFLGLGVPPPQPSWGVMLQDGFELVREAPWPVLVPGLALMLTTLGFTLLGEALRDRLDPRLSGVDGRPG
ncbi:MAG: ABC transporter permease subunit [Actinophytocola sp.]|nr:ABC transporter permease subunit [Actinophytocola sp.]